MYCPKCSQPQASAETQFCSRCGVRLNDLSKMVLADGTTHVSQSKTNEADLSPRRKGVRQGVALMLLSVILIPAYILLAALFPANDRLVESSVSDTPFEKISQAILFTIFMLGLARALYARLFLQGFSLEEEGDEAEAFHLKSATNYELPPAQSFPVSGFGSWRADTGEIAQPRRAREHTTKSLDAD
jgi:hypothetical protein